MRDRERAYPRDLAAYARARWPEGAPPPPPEELMASLIATAYHASLLRDEERAVSFRLLHWSPEALSADAGPPTGLHRLRFERPRPFDENELRRLSPAAKFHRALIGVEGSNGDDLRIWGLAQSGPRWMHAAQGGRTVDAPPPDALIVTAMRPGHIGVACGAQPLAELRSGAIVDFGVDVFQSSWLPTRFVAMRNELLAAHEERRARAAGAEEAPWATVTPDIIRALAQQMIKRVVAIIRAAHHGGTIIVLPSATVPSVTGGDPLRLKYTFSDDAARRRFRALLLEALTVPARLGGAAGYTRVTRDEYRASTEPVLAELDEAIFEVGQLIAALADVDGAVVLTDAFELVGFGAEIAGQLPEVPTVLRALDLEGARRVEEVVDRVGTRHRSAYRLCARLRDALAIVVSQDGSARFVTWHEGAVTYWDHGALGVGED